MPIVLAETAELADRVTPGVLGFTVIILIAAAMYFILRNMRRQLKNINFEEQRDDT